MSPTLDGSGLQDLARDAAASFGFGDDIGQVAASRRFDATFMPGRGENPVQAGPVASAVSFSANTKISYY
jgi:hypothetical protein